MRRDAWPQLYSQGKKRCIRVQIHAQKKCDVAFNLYHAAERSFSGGRKSLWRKGLKEGRLLRYGPIRQKQRYPRTKRVSVASSTPFAGG